MELKWDITAIITSPKRAISFGSYLGLGQVRSVRLGRLGQVGQVSQVMLGWLGQVGQVRSLNSFSQSFFEDRQTDRQTKWVIEASSRSLKNKKKKPCFIYFDRFEFPLIYFYFLLIDLYLPLIDFYFLQIELFLTYLDTVRNWYVFLDSNIRQLYYISYVSI